MAAARVTAKSIRSSLVQLSNAEIARHSSRFFKSGPGEYGEGDKFLGIRVPVLRAQARKYRDANKRAVLSLLRSEWHEERLLAVLLLVSQYQRGGEDTKIAVFDLYFEHRRFVNNWDLVDSSAHLIVGPHLEFGSRSLLYKLAKSTSLWDRRIAMMSTYHYIRQNDFADTLKIAEILIDDDHDLIHKIVGWMLREVGNRDRKIEEAFLKSFYRNMPRTMLRYAIEKFPENRRKAYLNGKI